MPLKLTNEHLKLYLRGECSPAERQEIETFLLLPEGAAMLEEVLDESWKELKNFKRQEDPKHFMHFKEKFLSNEQGTLEEKVKRSDFKINISLLKYVAILICITSLGVLLNRSDTSIFSTPEREIKAEELVKHANPRGQTSIVTLPDSSKVYLGAESSIRFSRKFETKKREIFLVGEAFFDVVHLKDRPFVVNTGSIQTVVLGTSFKIDAHISKDVSVSVATGKVSVTNNSGAGTKDLSMLLPGETLTWNSQKSRFTKENVPISQLWLWKNGGLVFKDQSIKDISEILERSFDVHIDIDRSLSTKRLSASFPRTSITEILNVLAYTGKFSYTLKEKYVEIKKKS